jgi:hypothetical protein
MAIRTLCLGTCSLDINPQYFIINLKHNISKAVMAKPQKKEKPSMEPTATRKMWSFTNLKNPKSFSKPQLGLFIVVFGLIGFFLIRSFAASPLVASLEAEQMSLPAGGSVITDTSASGGKAVLLSLNGTTSGSVNFPSSVTSLTVMARGAQCQGAPLMSVSLDNSLILSNTSVSSTSWTAYSATPTTAIAAGTHSLSISFTNDNTKNRGNSGKLQCSRDLYLDTTNFYGPTAPPPAAPTVTLGVSPSSVSAGQSSVLTWASTNATACTASGAWSGSQPTSGSTSTGALNQSSTYTLSCTGSGGTASASTTVTVTTATTILTIGDARVLTNDDSGNGNLLVAQSTPLGQTATLQSLSFYVSSASGKLRLGLYDASGPNGGPGAKLAETSEITPVVGWNTAPVTQVSLPAGTYWLAYLASDNNLHFVKTADASSSSRLYSYTYGTMPSAFSATPNSSASHWSFYATLGVSGTSGGGGGGGTTTTFGSFVGVVGPNLPLVAQKGIKNDRIDIYTLSKSSVDTARAAGVDVVPILDYNPWSDLRPSGTSDHYAPDTTARRITWSQRMMADVTSKFSTPPSALEVWNEPFLQGFWSQGPNAAQFLDLVHQFSVVAWATPGYANEKILVSCDPGWGNWCDNLIAADTNKYLNDSRMFPTVHPYCNDRAPGYHSSTTDAQKNYDCDRYKFTYDIWKAHGAADPKVWLTEFGWVSNTPGSNAIGNEGPAVSEATQAQYTHDMYKLALASGKVAKAYSYMLSPCTEHWSYNWIRPDCTDKPVIPSIQNLILTGN